MGNRLFHSKFTDEGLGSEEMGEADYDAQEIQIATGRPHDTSGQTCLHEVFHIIERHYELNFEEYEVECLANGMYEFLTTMRGKLNR
jgi:hypothetical protein